MQKKRKKEANYFFTALYTFKETSEQSVCFIAISVKLPMRAVGCVAHQKRAE